MRLHDYLKDFAEDAGPVAVRGIADWLEFYVATPDAKASAERIREELLLWDVR